MKLYICIGENGTANAKHVFNLHRCDSFTDVNSTEASECTHVQIPLHRHACVFFIDASVASLFREMFYFIAQHQNAASNTTKKGVRLWCHCIHAYSERPFEKLLGRTNECQRILSSLSLSLLFHNLFTRLVLITRESYDFGTFGN